METTLLTASFLRAWYPQRYPTSPHLCQSDAVKYFRCQKKDCFLSPAFGAKHWTNLLTVRMTTVFSPSLQEVPSSVSLLLPFKQLVLPLHMRLSMQPPSPFSSLRCLFGYRRILFGRIPHRPACNETHQTVWIPHFSRYGQNVEQALDFNSRSFEEIQQIL